MEEDRVELIKYNIWEYANLASARLLIQDEVIIFKVHHVYIIHPFLSSCKWCEVIRKQLEKCSAEEEIEKCISSYGTGSTIPSMGLFM